MRTSTTLAAGVLLVSGTLAGLGTTAAAHATGTSHQRAGHASAHAVAAARRTSLTVVVTSDQGSTTVTTARFRPGNTMFRLKGRGNVEVTSLRPGYTLSKLRKDFSQLFSGDTKVVKRVDHKAVFWGGGPSTTRGTRIGIKLPAGTFYAVNFDTGHAAKLTVRGHRQHRAMPGADGTIRYVHEMSYAAPNRLPHAGWIRFTNSSDEPHFTELQKVKAGTTRHQIRHYLKSGANGQPPWALKEHHEALVASPGHSFLWHFKATRGQYVELCFWPSDETGMPHAFMGMFDMSTLH